MGLPPFLFSLVLSIHEVLSIAQAWKTAALYGSLLFDPSGLMTADREVNFFARLEPHHYQGLFLGG